MGKQTTKWALSKSEEHSVTSSASISAIYKASPQALSPNGSYQPSTYRPWHLHSLPVPVYQPRYLSSWPSIYAYPVTSTVYQHKHLQSTFMGTLALCLCNHLNHLPTKKLQPSTFLGTSTVYLSKHPACLPYSCTLVVYLLSTVNLHIPT